jgi:hypothetical protein
MMLSISNIPQPPEMEGSHSDELVSQDLCDKCQYAIDRVDNGYIKLLPFYQNSSLMKQSAENGCLLCGQFLAMMEIEQLEEPVDIDGINIRRDNYYHSDSYDSDPDADAPDPEGYWRTEYGLSLKIARNEYPYLCIYLDPQGGRRAFGFLKAESNRV